MPRFRPPRQFRESVPRLQARKPCCTLPYMNITWPRRFLTLIPLAVISLTLHNHARGQEVANKSCTTADKQRVVRLEIEIPAPISEVWSAFTTAEGLRSWMAPVAATDLKVGGIMKASYNPKAKIGDPANIKNRIISYVPESMLSLQVAQFPPTYPFDTEKAGKLWSVIQFERISEKKTRVILIGLGIEEGEEWDKLHSFSVRANGYSLAMLPKRFTDGPVDWKTMLKQAVPKPKPKSKK